MPYKSIKEAKDAGFPTSAEEIPLTLSQINKLAEIYDAIKERGEVRNPMAVAWTTWKKLYKKEVDKWVEITKAAEGPLIIEGKIPINAINARGWGIPDSDVENAINSAKKAVVRICERGGDEHVCDDSGDPYSEIGRVVDAYRADDTINVKVAIMDRIAKQKIEDGTWESKWSPYGHAKSIRDGWTEGVNIESLTLVRNPAWEDAVFGISASASEGVSLKMPLISLFTNDANMEGIDKKTFTQDDIDKLVKAAETKAVKDTQDKAKEDADKAIKAALENTVTKEEHEKAVKAALEKKASEGADKDNKEKETYTKDELDAKIEASVKQAKEQTKDDLEREHLASSIVDTLVNAGITEEADREKQLETLKVASGSVLHQVFENVTAIVKKLGETVEAAGKDMQFPVTTGGGSVGYTWDPVKQEFVGGNK